MPDNVKITVENAKFHCRTCLIKLKLNGEDERRKFIDISANLELQQMLTLIIETGSPDFIQTHYPRNICINCNKKLESFASFVRKVKQTANTLLLVFRETQKLKQETEAYEENERPNTSSAKKRKEINANDVLLETESVTLLDAANYCEVGKFDISTNDPFLEAEALLNTKLKEENDSDNEYKDLTECMQNVDCASDNEYLPASTNSPVLRAIKKERTPKDHSGIVRKRVAAYSCLKCKRGFVHKCHYNAHMLKVHEGSERPYVCDQCDKTYKNQSALRYHEYVAHKLGTKTFPCEDCGKRYKTEASLKYHRLALHLGQKRPEKCVCGICGAAFLNTKTLLIHNKTKHAIGDEDGMEYKCPNCDKLFQSPYTLKYHVLRDHMQEKNYMCAVCGVVFAKKFLLVSHMKVHASDTEKFPCNQCVKRFLSKSDVEKHIRMVHLKIKPHTCKHCGEAFGTQTTLRHHIYIHTGEKPYACNVCGQRFRQPTAMKTHRKTHFEKVTNFPNKDTAMPWQ